RRRRGLPVGPDDELAVDLPAELPPHLALVLSDLDPAETPAALTKYELAMDGFGRLSRRPAKGRARRRRLVGATDRVLALDPLVSAPCERLADQNADDRAGGYGA